MKSIILAGILTFASQGAWAFSFGDLKDQIIGQTKVTIHNSGGVAGFYDASVEGDTSIREGVIDHVLTNRFLTADLGWYSADNTEGVLVGGLGVNINGLLSTVFPNTSEFLGGYVPPLVQALDLGAYTGWGTDSGAFHYGFSVVYNFGGN